MTKRGQVYKCKKCGNIVEVLHEGAGQLVCCGEPMELLVEKTEDVGQEKHLPVVEQMEGKVLVKVGSIPHPMEEKHFIEWIEVWTEDGEILRKYLNPGDKPEAEFSLTKKIAAVREHCNIHGLWKV
ncbi:desulfoferrodoxin [bacterium]|nr:desulfoferrodoxin [bacterium]